MPFEVLPAGRCVHGLKESDDMINGGMFLFLSLGGRDTHIMKCVCVQTYHQRHRHHKEKKDFLPIPVNPFVDYRSRRTIG